MKNPLVFPLCLYKDQCRFKQIRKVGEKRVEVPVCRFDETCNQKIMMEVQRLSHLKFDLEKVREERFSKG